MHRKLTVLQGLRRFPAKNAELFAARFKEAGGRIEVVKRGAFGHHPHGVDPDKTATITKFITTAK